MISLPWRINQTNEPREKNWPDVKGTGAPPKAERFCIPSNSVCTPWVILAKSWSAKEPLILTNKQCLFTIKEKKEKNDWGIFVSRAEHAGLLLWAPQEKDHLLSGCLHKESQKFITGIQVQEMSLSHRCLQANCTRPLHVKQKEDKSRKHWNSFKKETEIQSCCYTVEIPSNLIWH